MLSFILEWGTSTAGNNARWALRIRVSISEMGSFITLPTGLGYAWNEAVQGRFTKGQPRTGEFAQVTVTATGDGAAIDDAAGAGVARQLRERGVILPGLEFGAQGGVLLHRRQFLFVSFKPSLLSHKSSMFCFRRFHFGERHAHQLQ